MSAKIPTFLNSVNDSCHNIIYINKFSGPLLHTLITNNDYFLLSIFNRVI